MATTPSSNDCGASAPGVWTGSNFEKLMQDINSLSGDALNHFLSQGPLAADLGSGASGLQQLQAQGAPPAARGSTSFGLPPPPQPSALSSSAPQESMFMDPFSFDYEQQQAAFEGSAGPDLPASSAAQHPHQHRPPPLGLAGPTAEDFASFFHSANSSTAGSSPLMPTSPFSATTDPGAAFDFGSILSDLRPNVPMIPSAHPNSSSSSPPSPQEFNKTAAGDFGQMMLCPSSNSSEDEPLFVNAKQYHRIMKRRAARSRRDEMTRLSKERKVRLCDGPRSG